MFVPLKGENYICYVPAQTVYRNSNFKKATSITGKLTAGQNLCVEPMCL